MHNYYESIKPLESDNFINALISGNRQSNKPITKHENDALFSVGSRNSNLTKMAGLLRRNGANEKEIFQCLMAINESLPDPLDAGEVENISKSIAKYEVNPNWFTNDSFAKKLAESLHDSVIYCDGMGFLVYKENFWQLDSEGLTVQEFARKIIDTIKADVEKLKNNLSEDDYSKLLKASKKLEAASFIRDSIKLFKSDSRIRVKPELLNKNKNLINLANGTFDLNDYQLKPFNPKDYLTSKLGFDYNKSAKSKMFKNFIDSILTEGKSDFVLRVFAYALEGHGREQKFFIFQGAGNNGKSTLIETMENIFGSLMVNIQPESLNGKLEGSIRNDLARLVNAKVMTTSETKAGTVLDSALIKQIAGNDKLTARFLHKEFFEFTPTCVPIIITNYLPVIDGSDKAMERRLSIVTFNVAVSNVDTKLAEKLKKPEQASAIFNCLISALKDYRKNGLNIPKCCVEDTKSFIDKSDLLKCFFDDKLVEGTGSDKIYAQDLYRKYTFWCNSNGYRAMSANLFKESFSRSTGLCQERGSAGRYWPNITFKK